MWRITSMEGDGDSLRVSGKSDSSRTPEGGNFHTESHLASVSGVLDLGTGSKNSKRIHSSSSRRFCKVSQETIASGGDYGNEDLKTNSCAPVGSHAEGSEVFGSGNLDGLCYGSAIVKKRRGFFERRHAKSSWGSTGDCGIGSGRLGNSVKGDHRSWVRNVGRSSASNSDGDVRKLRKRKEKILNFMEPISKRKDGGGFCVNFDGPLKKRSRVVSGKGRPLSGSIDDLHNLDQLSHASKNVDGMNLSVKKDGKDSILETSHVEGGITCLNHVLKQVKSLKGKSLSTSESSLQSKNNSRRSKGGSHGNSNDESLIPSLLNKKQKISKRIDGLESNGYTPGTSLKDDHYSSISEQLKTKKGRRKSVSSKYGKKLGPSKDHTSCEEVKSIAENSHKDIKESSPVGSVEHLTKPDITASSPFNHSLKVEQVFSHKVEKSLKFLEAPKASGVNTLSINNHVPKVEKLPKDCEKCMHVALDRVEDSKNPLSSQTDEQENLEQNAAQMLSSRFNSNYNDIAENDLCTVGHSANGLPGSRRFLRNVNSIVPSFMAKWNFSSSDADPRVLRPRKQKHKHFIKRRRRRFVEVSYREKDAYWVVNRRVKVFWPLDEQWYYGEIKDYNPERNLHYIKYDDRDEEWLSLGAERFKILLCKGELDDHVACPPCKTDVSEAKHAYLENCSSKGNAGARTCLESEPIISWLSRSSSRANSSSLGVTKMQKKSSLSEANLPRSVSLNDLMIDNKGKQTVSAVGVNEWNEPFLSTPFQLNKVSVNSVDGRDDVPCDSFSKKRKVSLVYFRRRLRSKTHDHSDATNQHPAFEGSLRSCLSLASQNILQNSGIEDLKQKLACAKILSGVRTNPLPCDPCALPLQSDIASLLSYDLVNHYQLRLILSIQTPWAFDPRARSDGFGLCNILALLNLCRILPVWPKVHLEMTMVNTSAFRILRFEGCLGHAVTLLCSVLLDISAPVNSRDPVFLVEFDSIRDPQLPYISISFKSVDDKGKETFFVFNLLNIEASNGDAIHVHGVSSFQETISSSDPLDADIRFVEGKLPSACSSALVRTGNNENCLYQADELCRSYPGFFWGNRRSLTEILLSFSSMPTFFLLLHRMLMMHSAIASFSLQNHFMLKDAYWSKQILIRNNGGLCIEPPSGGFSNLPTADVDVLVSKHSKAGARRDFIDDTHRRTVIRLRRYPCNMGSWQYAGRSKSSIVSPVALGSGSTSVFSSLSTINHQTASRSSQPTLLSLQSTLTTSKNPSHEMIPSSYDGYLWQQSTTAPRSMSNNSRVKSVRKSFSCRSNSWQEGRSRLSYNEFHGGSWRKQGSDLSSLLSEDKRAHSSVNQVNDDELPADLSDIACPPRYLDSLSCDANLLVTVGDRGWREHGGQVMLACHNQNGWRLLVKIQGSTRYTYKAHQLLQPGVTNRANHAIIWKGGKDWSLEFLNRANYMLFKEMHEECYNRNIKAASVKNIPIPGVHLIEDVETSPLSVPFVRGARYIRQIQSDIDMALDPSRVLYDMDDEDQEWLMQFRKSLDIDEEQVVDVSDEMFERAVHIFEKVAHTQQCEEFSCDEMTRFTSDVGPIDIMNAIYEHWRLKRARKGMPLIRHLQPPLWEKYQRRLKEWELAVSKLRRSSHGFNGKEPIIEKPPMFAFCLRPRGLEMPNKGSKQRSHKKIPAVGSNNVSPRELESYHFNGRKMGLSIYGDEKEVISSYEYSEASPRFHPYSTFSPRYASHMGPPRNREWLDSYHSTRVQHVNRNKMGVYVPSHGGAIPVMGMRNGLLHVRKLPSTKWVHNIHYQSDSSMEHSSDQSGSTDREEFRLRDPLSSAKRASALAKLKRLKAQRLLHKADLALHKAMVALVTAELIQSAENDSKESE